MGWLARFVFLTILCVSAIAQTESRQPASQTDRERTAWIADVMNAMQTIKVA